MDELRRPEANTRLMYRIVCWLSGFTILTTIGYGIAEASSAASGFSGFGASMVDASFPLPFFAEPVTYLSVACVTLFYASLRLWQNKVARWSHLRLASLQLTAIVVGFGSAYEVLYSFTLWGSFASAKMITGLTPSLTAVASSVPWELQFGAKVFGALLLISGYSVYFLRKVHRVRGLSDGI